MYFDWIISCWRRWTPRHLMSFNVGLFPSSRFEALRESSINHKSWVQTHTSLLSPSSCPQPPFLHPFIVPNLEPQDSPNTPQAVWQRVPPSGHPQAERVLPDVNPPPLLLMLGAPVADQANVSPKSLPDFVYWFFGSRCMVQLKGDGHSNQLSSSSTCSRMLRAMPSTRGWTPTIW